MGILVFLSAALQKLLDGIAWCFVAVWDWFKGVFMFLLHELWDFMSNVMPLAWVDWINDSIENVIDLIGYAESNLPGGARIEDFFWIMPIREVMSVYVSAVIIVVVIRALRLIKTFIPAISG